MKNSLQRDDVTSLLFGLTDKSVELRNRWRGFAAIILWVLLSGFTMIFTIFSVQESGRSQTLILIGLGFLKYIPLLAVVYGFSRKKAARYLDDVYELHNEGLSSAFLEEVTFGLGREKITINEGKINEKDERSPIILIGGPGYIQVNLDSVALLEKVDGEPKVIYPRNEKWRLGRFERIREIDKFDEVGKREYAIINLRDQFVSGLSIKSRTKDGIPIEAHGIKIIFSILRGQKTESDTAQTEPYLFDENAVQALVYNQTIITPEPSTPSGVTFPWDTTVIPLIVSELEKLVMSRTLSEILATISQVEVDQASSNDYTIAQMRVEMTGPQSAGGVISAKKESRAPNFESRSKITAQFFEKEFKEKAAKLGVSIEWIDIGTWHLPSSLILEKHKEAWNLARENAKKRAAVERSGKRHEMKEIVNLIDSVIIDNYENEKATHGVSFRDREVPSKEIEEEIEAFENFFAINPELKSQLAQRESNKKDAATIAHEMLKAFRKELLAGKLLIENESKPQEEKQAEIAKIDKALHDISHLTSHWIQKPS